MRTVGVLLLFGAVAVRSGGKAYSAAPCTPELTEQVRAPITSSAPAQEIHVDCNLQLAPGDVVQKRLILEGPEASGVVIDCNSATLDGGAGTPNDGRDMIEVTSRLEGKAWLRPTGITIRNCNINGSMRIRGMGANGEAEPIRASSRQDAGHVARVRAAAPTRITLDNLTITATARTPLYLAPGVTHVALINSELKGEAIRTGLYLDAESAYNTIKNNYLHVKIFDKWIVGISRLGPQVSVDTSSFNRIIDNRLSSLEGGGIYLFRNCGEGGTVRHGSPSGNLIVNNVFYYDKHDGGNPSVYLGSRGQWWRAFLRIGYCNEDDGFPWGSSTSDDDHARDNVVMQNQIYKLPINAMIRQGDASNRPNLIDRNETVSIERKRLAGCYIEDGYKNFLLHGESRDVFIDTDGIPHCIGRRATCNDGTIVYQTAAGCIIQ